MTTFLNYTPDDIVLYDNKDHKNIIASFPSLIQSNNDDDIVSNDKNTRMVGKSLPHVNGIEVTIRQLKIIKKHPSSIVEQLPETKLGTFIIVSSKIAIEQRRIRRDLITISEIDSKRKNDYTNNYTISCHKFDQYE